MVCRLPARSLSYKTHDFDEDHKLKGKYLFILTQRGLQSSEKVDDALLFLKYFGYYINY